MIETLSARSPASHDMTFTRLLERVRVETARKWLQSTDCSIADIAVSEISYGFLVVFPADSRLEMFENGGSIHAAKCSTDYV